MSEGDDKRWHLDKRVPLALIATVVLQTATLIIWGTSLTERVSTLERQALGQAPHLERIVRLETKMDAIFSTLAEIKSIVQRPNAR